jgi:tRNA threonylcarbamoyladenosine biosynthesis protein TsaB
LPIAKALIADGQAVTIDDIQPVYLRDKVTWKKLPGRE